MTKIMLNTLNHAQAEAVYSAMVALNNVGGRVHVRIDLEDDNNAVLHACEFEDGTVQIFIGDAIGNRAGGAFEQFSTQNDFAKAYGF